MLSKVQHYWIAQVIRRGRCGKGTLTEALHAFKLLTCITAGAEILIEYGGLLLGFVQQLNEPRTHQIFLVAYYTQLL